MNTIKTIFLFLLEIIEQAKGPRSLVKIHTVDDPTHHYEFKLSDSSNIIIHCSLSKFELDYHYWWMMNRYICVYKVYAVIGNNATQELKDKFHGRDFHTTDLWHRWANVEKQKKAAIAAFLDIVYQDSK